MPDGRMLSKSIATSEQVARVSLLADYLFTRMIPHLDCEGRMPGSPRTVRGIVCPLRDDVTTDQVGSALQELQAVGLVIWYAVDGQQHVEFPKFRHHQRGARFDREGASRIPPSSGTGAVLLREYSGSGPGVTSAGSAPSVMRDYSGSTPVVLPLSEVKGSEVKNRTTPAAPGTVTWLTPYLGAWRERFGGDMPAGAAASHLAASHKEHGPDETLRRWGIYLGQSEAQYASPARFAATWGQWSGVPADVPKLGRPARVLAATEM